MPSGQHAWQLWTNIRERVIKSPPQRSPPWPPPAIVAGTCRQASGSLFFPSPSLLSLAHTATERPRLATLYFRLGYLTDSQVPERDLEFIAG